MATGRSGRVLREMDELRPREILSYRPQAVYAQRPPEACTVAIMLHPGHAGSETLVMSRPHPQVAVIVTFRLR